jgi:hypothetical protein
MEYEGSWKYGKYDGHGVHISLDEAIIQSRHIKASGSRALSCQ